MKLAINKNIADAKLLALPLSAFTSTTEYAVTAVRDNYEYQDGIKTDKWQSTTLSLVDTVTFASFNVKVTKRINLTQEEIDASDEPIFVEISLEKTTVYPYEISYSKAKLSIQTDAVKIMRE